MLSLILTIITRIFSNSYLNVFQKQLTTKGEYSSVVNFYTYLGLSTLGLLILDQCSLNLALFNYVIIMGFLGALGNYFIIKALSCGELSTLAPINSYKPIIALIIGIFLLGEIPSYTDFAGIALIITGTFILASKKILFNKATTYRFLALIFSATEAIFIKKVILLSNINTAILLWAIAGLLFSFLFILTAKHPIKLRPENYKLQLGLIVMVAIMQYSTNYVFSKMDVAIALALFQLSTILSVFLGAKVFQEKGVLKKLIASLIMIMGATILILT